MATKKKLARKRFLVLGTADYFRDRDLLFKYGRHTIERAAPTKVEAMRIAYEFMDANEVQGREAKVWIEEQKLSRGQYYGEGYGAVASWRASNWGERGEAEMRRNKSVDEDDIRDALESQLQTMADESAAQAHSMVDDQLLMDLGELDYDTDEVYVIAEFGDEVGVSEDLLVDPSWYKELGLEPPENVVDKWGEASTKEKGPGGYGTRADWALIEWLREQGYEQVKRLGGAKPTGDETEIEGEFVVERVAQELGAAKDDVWEVLEAEFGASRDGQVYYSSNSGQIDVYAIPLESEDDED